MATEYNYQSNLRKMTIDVIRDSFDYALILLEEECIGQLNQHHYAWQVCDYVRCRTYRKSGPVGFVKIEEYFDGTVGRAMLPAPDEAIPDCRVKRSRPA